MKAIQGKLIKYYDLPFDVKELQIQQDTCPVFKHVYDFLVHDILPGNAKTARIIRSRAEDNFYAMHYYL